MTTPTRNANFAAQLLDRWQAASGRDALRFPDGRPWTYAELATATGTMAARLRASGVQAGDRVLVQADKSPQCVALYLGALQLGAIYVPLNTAYTAAEMAHFVNDAEPRVVVCRPPDRATFTTMAPHATIRTLDSHVLDSHVLDHHGLDRPADATPGEDSLTQMAVEPLREVVQRDASDLAAIVYTSGTTGRSRGAMLTHHNLATNAQALVNIWGWRDDDVLLHALPIYHVHGLFVAMHCAFLTTTPMIWLEKFDAASVCPLLAQSTVLMGVPTFYTRLLNLPAFDAQACRTMRLFISGSAPLTEATFNAFEARTGQRILERYGMSETLMNTSNPLHGERLGGTVGMALPGVAVRIATAADTTADTTADRPAPEGTVGPIEVRGENVFQGYWRMPERTAAEFTADGWFRTGDLGTLTADGRLAIVGRAKDLIISGGLNIYPKEIERSLDALPGVDESAVIGVPHPDFGEAVVAVLVGADAPEEQQTLAALADQLARFKQPKRVVHVPSLPRNAMGKVQKNVLREQFHELFA